MLLSFSKFIPNLIKGRRTLHISTSYLSSSDSDDKFCIVSSPHDLPSIVTRTIPEFLFSNLHKWENATAFECAHTGRKYTHLQVYKQSHSFAAALLQNGIGWNDTVAIFVPNIPEYATIVLGIMQIGGIVSPFNPTYTAYEITTQLNISETKCIVTIPALLPLVKEARLKTPLLKSVIIVSDDGGGYEGCHTYSEMVKVNSDGVDLLKGNTIDTTGHTALIPWSSGTTGPPKGVMLTHSSVATNMYQYTQPGYLGTRFFEGGNQQSKYIGILPFFHIYGLSLIMGTTLYQGAHTLTMTKFEPSLFVEGLRKHRPTYLWLVPPLMSFLASNPDLSSKDFESVTSLMCGAAPVGPSVTNRLLEKIGKHVFFQEGYGMTELSGVSNLIPETPNNDRIGYTGVPVPGTFCKIVDVETGKALGPGQTGEVCVKGPQIMKGYYKNAEATHATIDSDGWLHTGDLGMYDTNKYFQIVDRLKELIKVSGFQVAPSELEDLIRTHPCVADVAVIGIPDERAGELPRAYIIPKPATNPSEDEIHTFISSKVSTHKKLKGGIEFVQIIPKSLSGKILRRELKLDYITKHGCK